jgi:hypothetical protein
MAFVLHTLIILDLCVHVNRIMNISSLVTASSSFAPDRISNEAVSNHVSQLSSSSSAASSPVLSPCLSPSTAMISRSFVALSKPIKRALFKSDESRCVYCETGRDPRNKVIITASIHACMHTRMIRLVVDLFSISFNRSIMQSILIVMFNCRDGSWCQ